MKTRIRAGAAALMALLLVLSSGCGKKEEEVISGPTIGYAVEGVTVVDNSDSLSEAVQKMYDEAAKNVISLALKNQAFSMDGINFDCYLANPDDNPFDMYLQIFGDAAMQDELFLSGLLRPGTAFNRITLNHALNPGQHTVYCIFTLVETAEDGTQTIGTQSTLELEFHVAAT